MSVTTRWSRERLCDLALAVVTGAYLVFAYLEGALRFGLPPVCPWLRVTGMRCLLCGSTRAIGSWLHGESVPVWSQLPALFWLACVAGALSVSLVRLAASKTWSGQA